MPNSWRVGLRGKSWELNELLKLSSEEWSVSCEAGSSYFLSSPLFDGLDDPRLVLERADELVRQISGAMALFLDSAGISVWLIERLQPDKPPHTFILPDSVRMGPSRAQMRSGMAIALSNASEDALSKVLQHLDPVHNEWEALYRAFEEFEADGSISSSVSKAKKNSFTQTANHHRHAGSKQHPLPERPMTISDAKALIRELVDRWIEEDSRGS